MRQPLVSIILPVHGVERYIAACVESIVSQDYTNIEIVLVDDGSTDESVCIAEKILSSATLPYKIIRQDNRGVSAARNRGIEASSGELVMMIDPDDVIDKSFVSSFVSNADLDDRDRIVFCEFQVVGEGRFRMKPQWDRGVVVYKRSEALHLFMTRRTKLIVTAMLVSRSFLDQYAIRFDEGVRFSEDVQFVWKVLCSAGSVVVIRRPLYNYLVHPNSTMTASGVDKILTGYEGLKLLYGNYIARLDGEEVIKNQMMGRWVLGALHASAKMLSYKDFVCVAKGMDYRTHARSLMSFRSVPLSVLSAVLLVSKSCAYLCLRFL